MRRSPVEAGPLLADGTGAGAALPDRRRGGIGPALPPSTAGPRSGRTVDLEVAHTATNIHDREQQGAELITIHLHTIGTSGGMPCRGVRTVRPGATRVMSGRAPPSPMDGALLGRTAESDVTLAAAGPPRPPHHQQRSIAHHQLNFTHLHRTRILT